MRALEEAPVPHSSHAYKVEMLKVRKSSNVELEQVVGCAHGRGAEGGEAREHLAEWVLGVLK
jgi:hypothetical protein